MYNILAIAIAIANLSHLHTKLFTAMMIPNPFESFAKTLDSVTRGLQTHLSHLFQPPPSAALRQPPPLVLAADATTPLQPKKSSATPLTKEDLGRATWTLLHTVAAQFPDNPTRQQKRDAKELMAILSRLYPCKECADHFKEVLKANPVRVGSHAEFSQWLCHVHNVVNRSLDKVIFPCERVDARWGKLECEDRACDLQGTSDLGKLL